MPDQPTSPTRTTLEELSDDDLLKCYRPRARSAPCRWTPPLSGSEDPAELVDLLGEDDPEVEQAVDMEAIASHWGQLPCREQRILIMRYYGNLTQEQIASQLGISQRHVSRLQARALGRLRDWLCPDQASPRENTA